MNYLVAINGLLYLGAGFFSAWHNRMLWACVWLAYGISAFALFILENGK